LPKGYQITQFDTPIPGLTWRKTRERVCTIWM
jgi:Asp-tRNA(Asn)/Glu-tRNA(Gln) amidotransferase B subunit